MPPRRPRSLPATLASVTAPPPVGVDEQEPADYAADSVELLQEEEAITASVPAGPLWKKLSANWMHFIEDVLEGWVNEGRTFPNGQAKEAAIGALVTGTLERVKKDPRGWIREHCDRR